MDDDDNDGHNGSEFLGFQIKYKLVQKKSLRRSKMVSSASSANIIKKEGRQNNF